MLLHPQLSPLKAPVEEKTLETSRHPYAMLRNFTKSDESENQCTQVLIIKLMQIYRTHVEHLKQCRKLSTISTNPIVSYPFHLAIVLNLDQT